MRSCDKGDLGELAVYKQLKREGLSVFPEFGSGSRVDAIAMDARGRLYKIQVKTTSSLPNGSAVLNLRKNTLNKKYDYHYDENDVDLFALYIEDLDTVAFFTTNYLFVENKCRNSIMIRLVPAKNSQKKGSHLLSDFTSFPFRVD